MTLSSTDTRDDYNGDGSTVAFTINFVFWDDTDISVTHRDSSGTETAWVKGTHYTLTGGSGSTGTLTVETSPTDYTPASGETLTILSNVPKTQTTSLPEGGPFPSASVEQRLDKITRLIQQVNEELGRSIVLPTSSTLTGVALPEPGGGEFIRWNSGGTALQTAEITAISSTASGVDETSADTSKTKLINDLLASLISGREAAAVASATTATLPYASGTMCHITGTTTIAGFTAADVAGRMMITVFDSVLQLTNSASLILLGGANVTTAAGDIAFWVAEDTSGTWRMVYFKRKADSQAVGQAGQIWMSDGNGRTLGHTDLGVGGRLTLSTGVPITTSDVTGAGAAYFAPSGRGNVIWLYDTTNSVWRRVLLSAEISIAFSGGTASRPHDIFCYNNSGTPELELLTWTNTTTRATALTSQNGVQVKTGDASRRYLGTVYLDGSKQSADSVLKRNLWNEHNRVWRPMRLLESTDSWTYTTAAYRQWNNSGANQFEFTLGRSLEPVRADFHAMFSNTNLITVRPGIGLNGVVPATTTTRLGDILVVDKRQMAIIRYESYIAEGRHVLAPLEYSAATGTTTWYGDSGTSDAYQAGMFGGLYA